MQLWSGVSEISEVSCRAYLYDQLRISRQVWNYFLQRAHQYEYIQMNKGMDSDLITYLNTEQVLDEVKLLNRTF